MINVLENIERLIPPGGTFEMIVTGRSMLPLLGVGRDTILVRRVTADEDIFHRIAMFRAVDGRIIVHRVIDVCDGVVTLRGDGNLVMRESCRRDEIIGVVERVIRSNGTIVDCTSGGWRMKERVWIYMPQFVRRCVLAVMHRWLNWKNK